MTALLTDELVYRLAPDSKATQLALELVKRDAYQRLCRSPDGTWLNAACQGREAAPYSVRIDLGEGDRVLTFCTCESRKQPCKHALGLLFLAARQPERFTTTAPSDRARANMLHEASAATPKETAAPASPTSVGEALFQNICAEPLDDAPRLIYADWLEEQGDEARAEFIRVQCQIARLGPYDKEVVELSRREEALLKKHQSAWRRDVPRGVSRSHAHFERGFVSRLAMPARMLLKHGAALFQHHPIHHLVLTGQLLLADAAKVAVCPFLARVRILDLDRCLEANALKALFATPFLSGVIELRLVGNQLGAAGMRALAGWPGLAQLERLNVSENNLQGAGVRALLAAPAFSRLRQLDLTSNGIDDNGAAALASATQFPSLAELILTDNNVGSRGAKALAASPLLQQLTVLALGVNSIGEVGAQALIASPFPGPGTQVYLGRNELAPSTCDAIRARFGPGSC